MTRVVADITVSLDGFVTGPDAGPGNGLGTGGEPLHKWVFSGDPGDQRILEAATTAHGSPKAADARRERLVVHWRPQNVITVSRPHVSQRYV